MRATFQKGDRREEWLRFPGGSRGGWFRPNDEFLSTQEAFLQGWRILENQEVSEN